MTEYLKFICIFQITYKKPKLFLEVEKASAIFNMLIIENLENTKIMWKLDITLINSHRRGYKKNQNIL